MSGTDLGPRRCPVLTYRMMLPAPRSPASSPEMAHSIFEQHTSRSSAPQNPPKLVQIQAGSTPEPRNRNPKPKTQNPKPKTQNPSSIRACYEKPDTDVGNAPIRTGPLPKSRIQSSLEWQFPPGAPRNQIQETAISVHYVRAECGFLYLVSRCISLRARYAATLLSAYAEATRLWPVLSYAELQAVLVVWPVLTYADAMPVVWPVLTYAEAMRCPVLIQRGANYQEGAMLKIPRSRGPLSATPRNQTQETEFCTRNAKPHLAPGMRFLIFDFALYNARDDDEL
eukprot:3594156-Rhodomonas_salina.1